MKHFFELEINGKLAATRYRYASLKQKGELSGQYYEIFTYKKSAFGRIGKTVTRGEIDEVADLRRSGKTWDEIAVYLGWNKKTLQKRLKTVYGTVIQKTGRLTDDKKIKALEMLMDGVKRYQIAAELGLSVSTIYRLFQDEEFMGKVSATSNISPMGIATELHNNKTIVE